MSEEVPTIFRRLPNAPENVGRCSNDLFNDCILVCCNKVKRLFVLSSGIFNWMFVIKHVLKNNSSGFLSQAWEIVLDAWDRCLHFAGMRLTHNAWGLAGILIAISYISFAYFAKLSKPLKMLQHVVFTLEGFSVPKQSLSHWEIRSTDTNIHTCAGWKNNVNLSIPFPVSVRTTAECCYCLRSEWVIFVACYSTELFSGTFFAWYLAICRLLKTWAFCWGDKK